MKDTMCGLVKEVNAPSGLVYHTDLPIPEINDDEVLIKVHCSAICGTDLHIMEWDEWSQKRIKAPVTVGHETAGEIVAVDNGDPTSFESFQATKRKAFNGLALVIVRPKPGATGPFTVKAASPGLATAEVVVTGE